MQQAEGAGLRLSPFLWFCKDGGYFWVATFTLAQSPAQFLGSLLGPHCLSGVGQCLLSTSCAILEVHQLGATHMPPFSTLLS